MHPTNHQWKDAIKAPINAPPSCTIRVAQRVAVTDEGEVLICCAAASREIASPESAPGTCDCRLKQCLWSLFRRKGLALTYPDRRVNVMALDRRGRPNEIPIPKNASHHHGNTMPKDDR